MIHDLSLQHPSRSDNEDSSGPSPPEDTSLPAIFSANNSLGNAEGKSSFWRRGASRLPGSVRPVQAGNAVRTIGAGLPHGLSPIQSLSPATSQGKLNPSVGRIRGASPAEGPRQYNEYMESTNSDWIADTPSDSEEQSRYGKVERFLRTELSEEDKTKKLEMEHEMERQAEKEVLALNKKIARIEKFKAIMDSPNVDLAALRKLSWGGIPDELRPMAWQLLLGYLPCTADRRLQTLARKRREYEDSIAQNYARGQSGLDQLLWHQIHIDVPRTNPGVALYQCQTTQECLERVLYCWAIRHPASGYVQGINDLCTPFFQVFLSAYTDQDPETCDTSKLSKQTLTTIEADTFWCLTKLLDGIQDNYTFAQPGIQRQIAKLRELISRIDAPLSSHLQSQEVEFIQFAFRWMNCLLMREMSLKLTIRMWDTYLAEGSEGFAGFHLYVCAAFLVKWSEQLRNLDFQGIMMFLQSIPTDSWGEKEIELLLSEAYMWQTLFQNAQSHLAST